MNHYCFQWRDFKFPMVTLKCFMVDSPLHIIRPCCDIQRWLIDEFGAVNRQIGHCQCNDSHILPHVLDIRCYVEPVSAVPSIVVASNTDPHVDSANSEDGKLKIHQRTILQLLSNFSGKVWCGLVVSSLL